MCFDIKYDPLRDYVGKGAPTSIAGKFMAAMHNFATSENPDIMKTILFQENVTVPYTNTLYSRTRNAGSEYGRDPYEKTNYDPPIVTDRSYEAVCSSWAEARKVETGKGAEYEIHMLSETDPGVNRDKDRKDEPLVRNGKTMYFSKKGTLEMLAMIEENKTGTVRIHRDGAHRLHYFGRYVPSISSP